MKQIITLFALIANVSFISAQTTAVDSVKATINHFFAGMKNADTAAIRATLTEGVIFQSIAEKKDGSVTVRTENVSNFFTSIAKQEKGKLDERITFANVSVDGALASVWTPYRFYVGEQFLHCGANSFQLVRINNVWRIQYIVDTRRKNGCD
jgi:ketosteroid isomerase-like protein